MNPTNFWAALGFLTIIPIPRNTQRQHTLQILFFPVVGILIGAMAGAVDWIGHQFLYPEVRAILVVLFLTLITGGLHLDGLADSADGLLSHRDRDGMLQIMRDPRIGTMGTLALFFALALKIAAVTALSNGNSWFWLIVACGLARSGQVMGLVLSSYARTEGGPLQHYFQKGAYSLLVLIALPLAFSFYLGITRGMTIWVVFFGLTLLWLAYTRHKIGGTTGDTLGALSEILETSLLLLGGWWVTHG